MTDSRTLLETENLAIGYSKPARKIVENLNLSIRKGEMICLLGPNGAGKSTLLRTLAGIQKPLEGRVRIDKDDVQRLQIHELAQKLSLVLTERISVGNFSVYDLVSLGRHPYTDWLGLLSANDQEKIHLALELTEIQEFITRNVEELSDGERQKVMIARALAQDTPLIILDEPTAHLDLPNRVTIFRLLRKLAKESGKAILMSTHELDFALQTADKIWLMNSRGVLATGTPEDLVLQGTFEDVFKKEGITFDRLTGTFRIREVSQKQIRLWGKGVRAYWTARALERAGYQIVEGENIATKVEIRQKGTEYIWFLAIGTKETEHLSLGSLLAYLEENALI